MGRVQGDSAAIASSTNSCGTALRFLTAKGGWSALTGHTLRRREESVEYAGSAADFQPRDEGVRHNCRGIPDSGKNEWHQLGGDAAAQTTWIWPSPEAEIWSRTLRGRMMQP